MSPSCLTGPDILCFKMEDLWETVANALVDTLPVPMKLVLRCLVCREMEGEERYRVDWFVLSSSLPSDDGWPVLWVKSPVF